MVGGGKDREEMRLIDADALCEKIRKIYDGYMLDEGCTPIDFENMVDEQPTAFDSEKVVEQLNNVLQDLNVIEVIDHIVFDSTIQTSLENFLNAFKSEIMRIVKNNACIDELLKGEE